MSSIWVKFGRYGQNANQRERPKCFIGLTDDECKSPDENFSYFMLDENL